MAKNKGYGAEVAPNNDFQADCDRDSLLRAAEITADRSRFRAAMAKMRKQQKGVDKMLHVLSRK